MGLKPFPTSTFELLWTQCESLTVMQTQMSSMNRPLRPGFQGWFFFTSAEFVLYLIQTLSAIWMASSTAFSPCFSASFALSSSSPPQSFQLANEKARRINCLANRSCNATRPFLKFAMFCGSLIPCFGWCLSWISKPDWNDWFACFFACWRTTVGKVLILTL